MNRWRWSVLCLLCAPAFAAQSADDNPLQLLPDHATLSVGDLEKEAAWYQRVLGFREIWRNTGKDIEIRHLGIPGFRIDLLRQQGSQPRHAAGALEWGWLHVVFRSGALDADFKRLTALGTDVREDKTEQGNVYRVVVHDPEGNEVEIAPLQLPPEMTNPQH